MLNVLVAVGAGIALSGLLLRWRDHNGGAEHRPALGRTLLGALVAVTLLSYVSRRVLGGRSALADPTGRTARFYRAHVLSALLGSLTIPLGLAYGWFLQPRLNAVAPFWVAALALGFLALPRAIELEDFPQPTPPSSETPA